MQRFGRCCSDSGVRDCREDNLKGRPVADLAGAEDHAATLFDVASSGGESESGPLEGTLGREHWLEATSLSLFVHSMTRVSNVDLNVPPFGQVGFKGGRRFKINVFNRNAQLSSRDHRVSCVERKI